MPKIVIDVHDLRGGSGNEAVDDLTAFLREKLEKEIDISGDELAINVEEDKKVPRPYLRVLLKKFLHRTELKKDYRVIAGKENSLVVKNRKLPEEEED